MSRGLCALATALICLACAEDPSAGGTEPGASAGPALSVRDFGAVGDGRTLDTAAIQAAVDALPPGGTLRFPPGTYLIETDKGVKLKDDVRLDLGEAVLVGANVDGVRCRMLEIQGGRNVVVSGGTLVGSRKGRPEWAMGILASDAEGLLIENVSIRNFFFDGILLTGNDGCRRVVVRGVHVEGCRRTGLAVVHAADVTVEDSTFASTRGQSPEVGVNCEPNRGEEVRDVRFRRCTFHDNAKAGIYIHRALGVGVLNASVEDSVVDGNGSGIVTSEVDGVTIRNNRVRGHHDPKRPGILVGETRHPVISGNRLEDNYRGIFSAGATGAEIRENVVVGTGPAVGAGGGEGGDGIVCLGLKGPLADACVVTENTVRRCAGSGIVAQLVSSVRLQDNTIEEVGQRGIFLRTASASEVRGNAVSSAGQEEGASYDAIELGSSSSGNTIATNVIHLGAGTHRAIGVCPSCRENLVTGNIVLPD